MLGPQFARTAGWVLSVAAIAAGCTTGDKAAEKAAMAQYAPHSSSAAIKSVSLSSSDRQLFEPARAGTAYPDTTHQVVVWYRWAGANPAAKVGIQWYKGGDKVLEQGEAFAKPAGSSAWVLKMDAGGALPSGQYRVDLLENGKQVTSIPFQVGDEQSASATVPVDTSEPVPAAASTVPADTSSSAPAATDTTPTPAASDTAKPAATPAAAPAAAASPSAGQGVETNWPGVFAQVTDFKRKGNALTLKLRLTNRGAERAQPKIHFNESYLLDAKNTKYEALKDAQGNYLAALHSGYGDQWFENIEPGASQTIWVKFTPPPAAVKTVTLQVPGMEPFEDQAIQDAQ